MYTAHTAGALADVVAHVNEFHAKGGDTRHSDIVCTDFVKHVLFSDVAWVARTRHAMCGSSPHIVSTQCSSVYILGVSSPTEDSCVYTRSLTLRICAAGGSECAHSIPCYIATES